jgi:hypothetical protein
MAWIRLDDDYVYHPKFTALSSDAFRLWHEGMAYCRKMMTDGLIRRSALKTFRYAKRTAVLELTTAPEPKIAPLWEADPEGFRVHDYLDWNPSQEEDQRDRDTAKRRMRAFRGRVITPSVTPSITPSVTPSVPGQGQGQGLKANTERESERKPADEVELGARAGRLIEHYAELYAKYRHGAKLRLIGNSLEFQDACSLCETWTDDRLEKLATIVLTTDEDFISKTDRSFKIFALKATWADDRLSRWEQEHGAAV